MATYDLAVAYRIYPKVSKPSQGLLHGDDKLKFSEVCLRSFKDSLGSLKVKVWAILDGCPPEYRDLFERYFAAPDIVFVVTDRIGNRSTFGKQIDTLLAQTDAEFVYFAEDDYLYVSERFPLLLDFCRSGKDVDFVTPYDHPDYYHLELHGGPSWLRVFGGHHWRTGASTCLTFLTRKGTLLRYEAVFRSYVHGNSDCALWLSLTKKRVFNPFAQLKYLVSGRPFWKTPANAWFHASRQIILGRKVDLWIPVPGVATHWAEGQLSAGIDWPAVAEANRRVEDSILA